MKGRLLVLASASPRRRELLAGLGVRVGIRPADVDETPLDGESAHEHVARLAAAKVALVVASLAGTRRATVVLGADTAVVVDGEILGKPEDDDDALRMLRLLCGRSHDVLTGVRLADPATGREASRVVRSSVVFRPADEALLRWYVATGEPRDKAGAYAIQGLGVLLTAGLDGSWSNVVGLPLEVLPELFAEAGRDFWEFLRR